MSAIVISTPLSPSTSEGLCVKSTVCQTFLELPCSTALEALLV